MTTRSESKTPARGTDAPTERAHSSSETHDNRRNASEIEGSRSGQVPTPEERRTLIAQSAYLKSERRGFPSRPEEDWLEAEAEFDALTG